MKPSVYLAGPIRGVSFNGATDWRTYASQQLQPEIEAFSPLRGKEFLEQHVEVFGEPIETQPLLATKGIMSRDLFDVRTRDAILMNLRGATQVSIGSMAELFWAYLLGKPLVLIIEPEDELKGMAHDHAWVVAAAPFVVNSLDHGIAVIKAILLPNPGSTPLGFV